ncbi:Fip1 motif-domain-containing protein [Spinellus fusiger]|nr:Fip1 motif-domain-containing protein [Spinellus fusiger]
MMNSHLPIDEDDVDEFLYGSSTAVQDTKDSISNYDTGSSTRNVKSEPHEDEDLYQLYKGSTANETEEMERHDKYEDELEYPDSEPKEQQKQMEEDTLAGGIQEKDNEESMAAREPIKEEMKEDDDNYSDDDLEIMLELDEGEAAEASEANGGENDSPESSSAKGVTNPLTIKPGQQGKSSTTPQVSIQATSSTAKTGTGGIQLDVIGELNGQPITEVDLDSVEDKPWRKPGADITDFFNYGFNEVTWRAYCMKQKMLRDNKKIMGDMDMADFMSMGMMVPPSMMENGMPMGMSMGMPIGMNPVSIATNASGNQGMRNNRNASFPLRGSGRGMAMNNRSKGSENNDRDGDTM